MTEVDKILGSPKSDASLTFDAGRGVAGHSPKWDDPVTPEDSASGWDRKTFIYGRSSGSDLIMEVRKHTIVPFLFGQNLSGDIPLKFRPNKEALWWVPPI